MKVLVYSNKPSFPGAVPMFKVINCRGPSLLVTPLAKNCSFDKPVEVDSSWKYTSWSSPWQTEKGYSIAEWVNLSLICESWT